MPRYVIVYRSTSTAHANPEPVDAHRWTLDEDGSGWFDFLDDEEVLIKTVRAEDVRSITKVAE